jgi:hypothetical protein
MAALFAALLAASASASSLDRKVGDVELGITTSYAVKKFRAKPIGANSGTVGQKGGTGAATPAPPANSGAPGGSGGTGSVNPAPPAGTGTVGSVGNTGTVAPAPPASGQTGGGAVPLPIRSAPNLPPPVSHVTYDLPKARAPKGSRHVRGHFHQDVLTRIEWQFEPGGVDWNRAMAAWREQFGQPRLSEERRAEHLRRIAEWNDGQTRLAYISVDAPKGPVVYGILENAISSATVSGPSACTDFQSCSDAAYAAAVDERCEQAVDLYTKALSFKPDNPWGYYYRAIVRRGLADETFAQEDFQNAMLERANAPDFKQFRLPTPDELFGGAWTCRR